MNLNILHANNEAEMWPEELSRIVFTNSKCEMRRLWINLETDMFLILFDTVDSIYHNSKIYLPKLNKSSKQKLNL